MAGRCQCFGRPSSTTTLPQKAQRLQNAVLLLLVLREVGSGTLVAGARLAR